MAIKANPLLEKVIDKEEANPLVENIVEPVVPVTPVAPVQPAPVDTPVVPPVVAPAPVLPVPQPPKLATEVGQGNFNQQTPITPEQPVIEPVEEVEEIDIEDNVFEEPALIDTPTTPTEEGTPTQEVSTFDDIFKQFGITTQNSVEDVIKTVSNLYGFDEINTEISDLDTKFADDVSVIDDNPWLSEGLRRKRIATVKNKYDTKKSDLIDRLALQDNIVGRALTMYNQEKEYQQDLMFKAMDFRQDEINQQRQLDAESRAIAQDTAEFTRKTAQAEKDTINDIMISASQAGADEATLQAIQNSGSLADALANAGEFMQPPTEGSEFTVIGEDENGNKVYGFVDETAQTVTPTNLEGQSTTKTGGSVSWRHNNPGNIKFGDFASQYGATQGQDATDGGAFAIFPDVESGKQAMKDLLQGNGYANLTVDNAMRRWSNNGYGSEVANIGENTPMSTVYQTPELFDQLIEGMVGREGWVEGTSEEIETDPAVSAWAKQINEGKAKIDNAPAELRNDIIQVLANTIPEKEQAQNLIGEQKAQEALALKTHSGFDSAVGTSFLTRGNKLNWWGKLSGQTQDYIASVEQLIDGLSLENLIAAKERGATFGALSDSEMKILSSSATKLGNLRIREGNKIDGKVVGFNSSQAKFAEELDKIALQLDKGLLDNRQIMDDGTIIQQNPDGTFEEIK